MIDAGVFAVHRGFFGHTAFKEEPFTEREAWLWMIGAAAWKPMQKRVKRIVYDLRRGQLVGARSYLSEQWGWNDESKVRRFLDRLEKLEMIERKTTGEPTKITICNYDEYQFGGPGNRPATDQQPTGNQPQEEELNKSKNSDAAANDAVLSEEAWQTVGQCEIALGIDAAFVPPEWCGAHSRVLMGLRSGWNSRTIIESVKAQAGRKADPPKRFIYYEKGIAEAHARAAAPIPEAKIIDAQTFEVRRHAATENLVTVAKRFAEQGVSFGPRPGSVRSETDSNVVRLLPEGGGE